MKKRLKRVISLVMLTVILVISVVGCGKSDSKVETVGNANLKLSDQHYIFAGYDAFKPFRYIEIQPDGTQKVVGLDIAVVDELAKRLGFTYEFQAMPFASILASVESKRADFSFGFTYNDDREKIYDFTQGYFQPRVGIVSNKSLVCTDITSLKGKRIGCVTGTVQYTMLQEQLAGENIISYDTSDLCLQELISGRVDAYVCDGAEAIKMAEPHDNLKSNILSKDFSDKYLGEYHCMAWEGAPFIEIFNQTLTEMKADGTLDTLISKWVGADFTWK